MHTFEVNCNVCAAAYHYLHEHLPSLVQVSEFVERTNFYSGKGIMQIELRRYEYAKYGMMIQRYYLVLRCNASIIMGDSKVFLVDLKKYTAAQILERLQKRLYEVNEFRYVRLDKLPISIFSTNRADIAKDIAVDFPQLVVWLANMSFPYGYRNMKRKAIHKKIDDLYIESCCFYNGSRSIIVYHKWVELINNHKRIMPEEEECLQHTVRVEVQFEKKGIYNMKLPTKRSIRPFLEQSFCDTYVAREMKAIFGAEKFVSRSKAVELVSNSTFKPYDKQVMISIMAMIQRFKGLYELEKAIADVNIRTPPQYGNLRSFKERWLKKFQQLGIQPVTIPDVFEIDEIPGIYDFIVNN